MTEIAISVYHIIHFTKLIDNSFRVLEKLLETGIFEKNNNNELRALIQINSFSQILLYTSSLSDEYSNHFITKKAKTLEEKGKVEQTRELLKPVFKKINEWNDIKDFRNNILAHNLRIQKSGNESVFISKGISGYNIPEKVRDFGFLIQCVDLISQVVYQIFKVEYEKVVEEIDLKNNETKDRISSTSRNYENEYAQLRDEIWKRKKQIEDRFKE